MGKVKYTGSTLDQVRWGANNDPNEVLVPGEIYEVEDREVHSWHTKLTLVGFPGFKFNSVSFEEVD